MEMQGAAEDALSKYSSQLQKQYEGHMAQKMGLQKYDKDLAVGLMSMMYEDETGIAQAQEAVIALFLDTEPVLQLYCFTCSLCQVMHNLGLHSLCTAHFVLYLGTAGSVTSLYL